MKVEYGVITELMHISELQKGIFAVQKTNICLLAQIILVFAYCTLQVLIGCHKETDSIHHAVYQGHPQEEHCLFPCDNLPAKHSTSNLKIDIS